uniref:Coiled-coil domain-containing protein 39 n=1 Tax=Gouania willdenowi TaxID=441366 RepID=A0A8C5I833_GOUWI
KNHFFLIHETQRQLLELDNELEKNKGKKQSKEQFLHNLKETNKNTHAFLKVKESEIEIENHFLALKNGTKDQLAQKNAKMMNELKSLTEKETKLKDCIFNAKEKLEKYQLNKNWDQQTMEAFFKESAQKHEDMMALLRYAHQDDMQIKSLTRAIEKEIMDVNEHHQAFDKATTENRSALIALDKAKDNLHQALMDTQQFSNHWENSSKQMFLPDAEIQKCAQVLAQTCQDVRERKLTLSESKHLLATQKNNTNETERSLMLAKQQAKELQEHLNTEEKNSSRLQNELQSCRNKINKATSELKSLRPRMFQMKKEMRVNDDRFKKASSSNVPLKTMLQVATQKNLSMTERAAQKKSFLTHQQQAVTELHLQLRASMQELTDSKRHLVDAKASEKRLTIKVSGSKSTINALEKECKKAEEEQWRLEKVAFQQDSEIAALENVLAQLQGYASSDEKQIIEGKIAKMKKGLEEKRKASNNLKNAITETKRAHNRLIEDKKRAEDKKADLFSKNNDLLILCDLTEKELLRLRLMNQEKRVQTQSTQTETELLHDLLHKRTKSTHSSEIKKLDLLKAMKERESEIKVQKEMLSRQLQFTEQERHKLRLELNEKLRKVEIMKNRCEIVVSSILPNVEAEEAKLCQSLSTFSIFILYHNLTSDFLCLSLFFPHFLYLTMFSL